MLIRFSLELLPKGGVVYRSFFKCEPLISGNFYIRLMIVLMIEFIGVKRKLGKQGNKVLLKNLTASAVW